MQITTKNISLRVTCIDRRPNKLPTIFLDIIETSTNAFLCQVKIYQHKELLDAAECVYVELNQTVLRKYPDYLPEILISSLSWVSFDHYGIYDFTPKPYIYIPVESHEDTKYDLILRQVAHSLEMENENGGAIWIWNYPILNSYAKNFFD